MAIEVTVPRLGWSSEEGVFSGWLKQAGDSVVSGEPLFLLESDKVTMEVESLDGGILYVVPGGPETGGVVTVGQLLGYLLASGESAPEHPAATVAAPKTEAAPSTPVAPDGVRLNARHAASPRARAAAKRLGVDLSVVRPESGSARIVEADVLRAASASPRRSRRALAARLEESFRTPHFYVQADADATRLSELRINYNDLLIKAIALALRANPAVNSRWDGGDAVALDTAHVGLAVQTGEMLLVPVIRDADRLPLSAIGEARGLLVDKCRRGRAAPPDFDGASVTLSNLGPFGVDRFQAILNPPQSAIVAVGRVAKRPVVDGDAVVARLTIPLCVSVDHRVVDGVAAARFLRSIVELLEAPERLFAAR